MGYSVPEHFRALTALGRRSITAAVSPPSPPPMATRRQHPQTTILFKSPFI